MTMPFNLLRARRRLHINLERQHQLLADDVQRVKLNGGQLRRSLVNSATSPLGLGLAAVIGFFSTRKLLSPAPPRTTPTDDEPQRAPRSRSTLLPLLINLAMPTLITWLGERLLPLLHGASHPPETDAPEEDR